MRRFRPLWIAALVTAAIVLGHQLRSALGVELHPESLRAWVGSSGWLAPLLFVALVTFRQFLVLPSILLLSVGGICFGAAGGTVLGTTGILLSGLLSFALARGLTGERLRARLAARFPGLDRRAATAGPMLVLAVTAYPAGPMSGAFWASGFSSMRWLPFLIAVTLGGAVRSFAYSVFGATLLDAGSTRFWIVATVLALAVTLPLLVPGVRRRMFAVEE